MTAFGRIVEQLRSRGMNRRRFLMTTTAVAGSVASSSLLAACGGDDDDDDEQSADEPTASESQAPSGDEPTATEASSTDGDEDEPTPSDGVPSTSRPDLIVGLFGEPSQLNEFYRTGIQGGQVSHNIYEKLVRVNFETRDVDPELAVSWEVSDDGMTWILDLREGVTWHGDWGDFTADDVEFTFNYILEEETFQIGAGLFPVEGITKLGSHQVEVQLKQPFGAFIPVTCDYGGVIMCKAAHEEMGFEDYGRAPVGTGPFMFDSWQSGSQIVIKKNPNYWEPNLPVLDEITFRFVPDDSVRLASLRNGEIDFMDHPSPEDTPDLREGQAEGIAYDSVPGWNWDYMAFSFPPNVPEDAPWTIKEVRQAISYAIDRQTIVDELYAGEATVSDSPVPPGFLAYRDVPIHYPPTADLERAQELMDQAGVSGFDIEVISSDKEWLRREAELVGAMLSQIGINVRVQGLDLGAWTERWFGHQFEALLEDISIVSPDTDSCLYWFHVPGSNTYHDWPRPDVADMLDEARAELDQDVRAELYTQVVDEVIDDSPYIYFCHVNIVRLFNENLKGLRLSNQEYVLRLHTAYWE